MEMGVDVSVPSRVCKHFQKQHEPRPVPVEEGSCRAWRLLQHPLQLPVTWEGMQRKLTLVSLASDSFPHCPEGGCSGLSWNLPFWVVTVLLAAFRRVEEGSAHSHPTLGCSWQGPALPAEQGGKGGLGEPQEAWG